MNDNLKKMLQGKIYSPSDPELISLAFKCHDLCLLYNSLSDSDPRKKKTLDEIFPDHKENIYVQGNLYVDYGVFTHIGKNFYANYGLIILDTCPITIGDNCFFGPNVGLYTPLHPLMYQERNKYFNKKLNLTTDDEYGKPITIGDNCWLGGNVIVLPGVNIGSGSVIGAGSVVTHDIPPSSLAYGNPAKVVRKITEKDSIHLKKELF